MAGPGGPQLPGPGYRIRQGDFIAYLLSTLVSVKISGSARLIYDDGTEDTITFPSTSFTGVASGNAWANAITGDHAASKNGWVVECHMGGVAVSLPRNSVYIAMIIGSQGLTIVYQSIAQSFINYGEAPVLGFFQEMDRGWANWVFEGTVGSDNGVGTHVATLTVTPGAGGVMEIDYAQIVAAGAGGSVQNAYITDGTNIIAYLFQATAAGTYTVPGAIAAAAGAAAGNVIRLSGTMQLVLTSTTSTVSQTQTFSVAARILASAFPLAVLADSVGTPTLTTNTNKVF